MGIKSSILSGIMLVVAIIFSLNMNVYAEEEYGVVEIDEVTWSYRLIDGGRCCEITEVDNCRECSDGILEVPSEINGKPVTSIGSRGLGFIYSKEVEVIVIPDGVKTIEEYAFFDDEKVKQIIISDSVETIGKKAFYSCESLYSVKLPNGLKRIEESTFEDCYSLYDVEVPESVTSIGQWAFNNNRALYSINIPKNVTDIEREILAGCGRLSKITVSKENPVYNDGNGCNAIIETKSKKLIEGCCNTTIPDGVKIIGYGSFYKRYIYSFSLTIPDSVETIEHWAFAISNLYSIYIGDGVTTIGEAAFYQCSNMERIKLSKNLEEIECGTFIQCEKLEEIVIPSSVTSIGLAAFRGCRWLRKVDIPNSVTNIGGYAFAECSFLSDIEIPSSVTEIKCSCFYKCYCLKEIKIPTSVTSIESGAFRECSGLNKVLIWDTVESIAEDCFTLSNNATFYTVQNCFADQYAKDNNIPIVYVNISENIRFFSYNSETHEVGSEITYYTCNTNNMNGCTFPDVLIRTYGTVLDTIQPKSMDITIHDTYKSKYCGEDDYTVTTNENGEYVLTGYTINLDSYSQKINSYNIKITSESAYKELKVGTTALRLYDVVWDTSDSIVDFKETTKKGKYECFNYITAFDHVKIASFDSNGICEAYKDAQCTTLSQKEWDVKEDSDITFYVKVSKKNYDDVIFAINLKKDIKEVDFKDHGHTTQIKLNFSPYKLINGYDYEGDKNNAIAGIMLSGLIENSTEDCINGLNQLGLFSGNYSSEKYYATGFGGNDGVGRIITIEKFRTSSAHYNIVSVVVKGSTNIEDTKINTTPGDMNNNAKTILGEIDQLLSKNNVSYDNNTYFYVTGHSLGGAVANLLAAKMIDEKDIDSNHLKCYTFAAPLTKSDIDVTYKEYKYQSIKNYYHDADWVPKVSSDQVYLPFKVMVGVLSRRYGKDIKLSISDNKQGFSDNFNKIQGTSFDDLNFWNVLDSPNHYTSTYLSLLLCYNGQSITVSKNKRVINIHCPVDIIVLDSSGKTCVKIEDDELKEYNDKNIQVYLVDDQKILMFDSDSEYKINIIGNNYGDMGIEVIDYNYSNGNETISTHKTFDNINVFYGKTMSCDTSDSVTASDFKVYVTDEKGNKTQEIKTDGSEEDIGDFKQETSENKNDDPVTDKNTDKNTDKTTQRTSQQTTEQKNSTEKKSDSIETNKSYLLVDESGLIWNYSNKIKNSELKKNLKIAVKGSGKYKVLSIKKRKGKVISGTVIYMAPYNSQSTKASIPNAIKVAGVKFNVVEVNKNAFKNCKKLSKVTIGTNITKIGSNAFYGCSKLKSVSIKSKVIMSIGSNAFKNINGKATFKVPSKKLDKYAKLIRKAKAPKNVKVTK